MTELYNPFPQFHEDGEPLAFGVVYFGEPNVDTKTNLKTIYSDSLFTTPLENPQVLDANGQFKHQIELNGAYSILIERVNGTVFKEDPETTGVSGTVGGGGGVTQAQVDQSIATAIGTDNMFQNTPASNSALNFNYGPYRVTLADGTQVSNAGQSSIALPNNTTVFVYLNTVTGAVGQAATVPANAVPLYQVTTAGNVVGVTNDLRSRYNFERPFPTNYLDGLGIIYSSGTAIVISAGNARSDANNFNIVLPAITKTTATFALGSGGGLRDTVSLTQATTYYVFAIAKDDGTMDVMITDQASGTTFPTVGGTWQYKRLLGSFSTNAADTNIDPKSLLVETDSKIAGILDGSSTAKIAKEAISTVGVEAGANVIRDYQQFFSGTYSAGLWTTYQRYRVLKTGTFRFRAQVTGSDGSNTMRCRWLNNTTSALIVQAIATGATGAATADVEVTAGDIIYLQAGMDSGGRSDPGIRGRIAVSDQDCVAGGVFTVDSDDDI